jgi:hypothetical protein
MFLRLKLDFFGVIWPEIAFVLVRVPWSFNRVVLTRTEVEDDVNLVILIKAVINILFNAFIFEITCPA